MVTAGDLEALETEDAKDQHEGDAGQAKFGREEGYHEVRPELPSGDAGSLTRAATEAQLAETASREVLASVIPADGLTIRKAGEVRRGDQGARRM